MKRFLAALTIVILSLTLLQGCGEGGGGGGGGGSISTVPPTVFFVDAPVVSNSIDTPVIVYASNVNAPIAKVSLVPHGQLSPVIDLQISTDMQHPNRATAIVLQGTTAGTYDVIVKDQNASPGVLDSGLKVTGNQSVTITKITPPFGYNVLSSTITMGSPAAFVATPLAYLVPHAGGTAVRLATEFSDASTLKATVPGSLTGEVYDLVVVNPDGTAGILPNGFNVTTAPSPQIAKVTPSSITNATGQVVVVSGRNFGNSTISLACRNESGNDIGAPPVTSGTANGSTQSATIDGSLLPVGAICVLRLTNSDGSYADYSAVGVTNASLNLNSPHAGTNMTTGRRALAAASGYADGSSRFVYAIGGDDGGATPTVYDTVEFASVDSYGNMGQWSLLSSRLNTKRAFASSSVIGRYIYVAGGTDGTNVLKSVERAMILDPVETPHADIDDLVPATNGLDPGYWYYRVSAVLDASDPDNPGDETLPSNEVTVNVPSFPDKKVQAVLTWTQPVDSLGALLPNVSGYNIYRTPVANGTPGSERLIATVNFSTLTYADDGTAAPGTQTPLPLGSLGKWTVLPNMNVAREGAAGAAAADPAIANKFYFYSLLGSSTGTNALNTYEYLPVTVTANGRQSVDSVWSAGTGTSSQARWQLNAWVADSTVSSYITAPDIFIFLGGGVDATGNAGNAKTVEVGHVSSGGDLGVITDTGQSFKSGGLAGYGICAANGQLFAFGGAAAAPSSAAKFAQITSPGAGNLSLANNSWNDEGMMLTHARYLMGSSVQNTFIFLLGGQTDEPSAASRTTEVVLW